MTRRRLEDCCTTCPRDRSHRYCRDEHTSCPHCAKSCGRIDVHDEHEWVVPPGRRNEGQTYTCPGEVVVEGGHRGVA